MCVNIQGIPLEGNFENILIEMEQMICNVTGEEVTNWSLQCREMKWNLIMKIYQTNPQRKLYPNFRTLTLNIYKESFCVEIKIKKQKFFDEIIKCIF